MIDSSGLLRILSWPPLADDVRNTLAAGSGAPFEFFTADLDRLDEQSQRPDVDLIVLALECLPESPMLSVLAARRPVVLCASDADLASGDREIAAKFAARCLASFEFGVQDLMTASELMRPGAGMRLHAAVVRHRIAVQSRTAYSTDLATGLPHQQQFLEHMNHLLALREREPAPMALLVLSVAGLTVTLERLGPQAGAVLRRKLAVRLRSGLRASDVVASLDGENFAVLLSWIDASSAVERVVTKLMASARRPFMIGGQPVSLSVSVGIGRYPEDGQVADVLLNKAMMQANHHVDQGELFARQAHLDVPAANDDGI